jgi:hypothetical protein
LMNLFLMRQRERPGVQQRRLPARDVIEAVLENMRRNLEPLRYSILVPSRYVVYLHPNEYARLEGVVAMMREQTIRALSEEVHSRNGQSILSQYAGRFLGRAWRRLENPAGEWSVEFLPDPDGDMAEGDILIDSELVLPATESDAGEQTRLVTTLRSAGGRTTTIRKTGAAPVASNPRPFAEIIYDDASGHHSHPVCKDSVTIGRGGSAHPVDIRIVSSVDVSREHVRIRRDPRTGEFFLIDLSTLGTTLNGRHSPRGYEHTEGVKHENGTETQLPERARIGLADTVYLRFTRVRP